VAWRLLETRKRWGGNGCQVGGSSHHDCKWKKALLDGAADIFDKHHKNQKQSDATIDELYRQIGQLKVERDFLSKKLSL